MVAGLPSAAPLTGGLQDPLSLGKSSSSSRLGRGLGALLGWHPNGKGLGRFPWGCPAKRSPGSQRGLGRDAGAGKGLLSSEARGGRHSLQ